MKPILNSLRLILNNNIFLGLFFHIRKKLIKPKFISPENLSINNIIHLDSFELKKFIDLNRSKILDISKKFLNDEVHVYNKVINFQQYRLINYGKEDFKIKNKDVRFYWEILRNKWFFNVGLAFEISKDEEISKKTLHYLENFQDHCPLFSKSIIFPYCPMEASIRLYNLYWINYFFRDSIYFKKINQILPNIFQVYLNYIWKNHEVTIYGLESNHTMFDAFGLIFGSSVLSNHPKSKEWYRFGKKELFKGIKKQFFSDGLNFESSANYHKLNFEMLMICLLIFKIKSEKNLEKFEIELKKIASALEDISHSNFMISRFGDNDGGKLFFDFNSNDEFLSTEYLNSFKGSSKPFCETLIFPKKYFNFFLKTKKDKNVKPIKYFSYKNKNFSIISPLCSIGTNGKGNHQHNDFLSFELYSSFPFIVDPWSYCYTGSKFERNRDRATNTHNTIYIDKREIVEFNNNRIFEMLGEIKVLGKLKKKSGNIISFEMTHNGYKDLKKGSQTHNRTIKILSENKISIIDKLHGEGSHKAEINFLIPKKYWKLKVFKSRLLFENNTESFSFSFNKQYNLNDSFISSNFLQREPAYCINSNFTYNNKTTFELDIDYKQK